MHCVIGSGPAGVACAHALLERGARVHMVDGGIALEPWRAARVELLSAAGPSTWTAEATEFMRDGVTAGRGGVPLKLLFGSDFPYREAAERLGLNVLESGLRASLAQGGFSTVWGASMLPYSGHDFDGWPFGATRLAPHYRAVTRLTGLSAGMDDLSETFPLWHDRPTSLASSRQALGVLARLEANRDALADAGIVFGRSRLAVRGAGSESPSAECVQCGLCMHGCPQGAIYNSSTSLEGLREHPSFSYEPGVVVDTVREHFDGAVVCGSRRLDGEARTIPCERVFLAAGVLPTTRIILASMAAFDRKLTLADSQYFLVPLLLHFHTPDVRGERLHALSQVFLEITDSEISPFTVHLQLYTYSELLGAAVRGTFGRLGGLLEPVVRSLEGRLAVVQGYLHSAHSGTLEVTLRRRSDDRGPILEVRGRPGPETRKVVRRVLRKLRRHAGDIGASTLGPLLKLESPGRGFHVGGAFPMRRTPQPFESDELGRPSGWRRLHAVDASVLPSVPATTITLSVMANAHRIGWEAAFP